MFEGPSFNTYEEARLFYNLQEDQYLIMEDNYKSLNRVVRNGKVVYYIGIGNKTHDGYPSGNQQYDSQILLINMFHKYKYLYLFCKLNNGSIRFLGLYECKEMTKKMSFIGFSYYEFKLFRKYINKYY